MPRPKLTDETIARRRALGGNLRRERTALGMTREELAAAPELSRHAVTPQMIKRWETGESSIPAETLPDAAAAVGVTIGRLLGEHGRSSSPVSQAA